MKLLRTFFGQVLRKQDVDYVSNGYREGVTRLNIDMTAKQGGVISGLDVYKSIDGLSILVTPGTFYSSGDFNQTNNLGGGERGQVYTTQSFSGLPATSPIANQPSYLVVYVKIANQNSNPDPTQLQTTPTSKNIQTGENVLTRDYPVGTIAISNPVLLNQINTFNGVPLAVLQVDYIGTSQVSSNGTVQIIDNSSKRDYVIGGAVDVAKQQLLASAVPNSFITTRMIGSGQIIGSQFLTGTIASSAIAPYDGSLNVAYTGNGIATDHLKTGSVTQAKISFMSGLSDYSQRNYVDNASFEMNATAPADRWSFTGDAGTQMVINSDPNYVQDGIRSVLLQGGVTGGSSTNLSISQNVDFHGPINGQNLTAFFYAFPLTNFAGTDSINGVLTYYSSMADATANNGLGTNAKGSVTFASYGGITSTSFIQVQTTSPITVPADPSHTNPISVVNIAIKGPFSNQVYVDSVYLGLTSITPKFSLSLEEQIGADLNADNIVQGHLQGAYIAPGAITTNLIAKAVGGITADGGNGIRGDQIRDRTIEASNIALGTITSNELAAGIAAVPPGSVIMFLPLVVNGVDVIQQNLFTNPGQQGCPTGFKYVTSLSGKLPMGINPASTITNMSTPGNSFGPTQNATAGTTATVPTNAVGNHQHGSGGVNQTYSGGGGGPDVWNNNLSTANGGHAHDMQIPFTTVLWCQKQ